MIKTPSSLNAHAKESEVSGDFVDVKIGITITTEATGGQSSLTQVPYSRSAPSSRTAMLLGM
jgi:hypothetical protein